MKRLLAASVAALALFACQRDKASVEAARDAEQIQFTAGEVLDCTAPTLDEASRIVCADTELRALDRRIAELWTEASAVTGRPATFAWRHEQWLAQRAAGAEDWDTGRTRPRTQEELRGFYESYAGELGEELRQARALPASAALSALGGGCIGRALEDCRAPAAGYVTGPGGERLAWQIQEGSTDYAGVSAGVILFSIANDVLTPVGWSFQAAGFDAPVVFTSGDAVFVAAAGRQAGTGSQNADVLYRLDGDAWSEIELESWKGGLDVQLPQGLGVWKGVTYDWPSMTATTPLWRDEDANCCATGGSASMALSVEGRSLTLGTLDIHAAHFDGVAEN